MLRFILRLFPFVRDIERKLRESTELRIEAERRAVESLRALSESTEAYRALVAERTEEMKRMADFLATRAFGLPMYSDKPVITTEATIAPMPRSPLLAARAARRSEFREAIKKAVVQSEADE